MPKGGERTGEARGEDEGARDGERERAGLEAQSGSADKEDDASLP